MRKTVSAFSKVTPRYDNVFVNILLGTYMVYKLNKYNRTNKKEIPWKGYSKNWFTTPVMYG